MSPEDHIDPSLSPENQSDQLPLPSDDLIRHTEQSDNASLIPIEQDNNRESLAYRVGYGLGYTAVKASGFVSEKVQHAAGTFIQRAKNVGRNTKWLARTSANLLGKMIDAASRQTKYAVEASHILGELASKIVVEESQLALNGIRLATKDTWSLVKRFSEPYQETEAEKQQRKLDGDTDKARYESAGFDAHSSHARRLAHHAQLRQIHQNGEAKSKREHRQIGKRVRSFERESFDHYLKRVHRAESVRRGETQLDRMLNRVLFRPLHQPNRVQAYNDYIGGSVTRPSSVPVGGSQIGNGVLTLPNTNHLDHDTGASQEGIHLPLADDGSDTFTDTLAAPSERTAPFDWAIEPGLMHDSDILMADKDIVEAAASEKEEQVEQRERSKSRNKHRGARRPYDPQDVLRLRQEIDQEMANWDSLNQDANTQARAQAESWISGHFINTYLEEKKLPKRLHARVMELFEMPEADLRQLIEDRKS